MVETVAVILGLSLSAGTGPDPRSLIDQLGSARFADREAASEALQRLGREAFPALKDARKNLDPEVKNRAEVLLDTIEQNMLIRASIIPFEGSDLTVSRVVEEIDRIEGVKIPLAEEASTRRKKSVAPLAEGVSFWQAADLLGLALQWDADLQFERGSPRRASRPRWRILAEERLDPSDWGPVRVRPSAVVLAPAPQIFNGFAPREIPAPPRVDPDLLIPLEVLVEPKLNVRLAGPIKVFEASDNLGQSWGISTQASGDPNLAQITADQTAPFLTLQLRFKSPQNHPSTLSSVRGAIPVEISARRIDPVLIPLANSSQSDRKPIACGGYTMFLHGVVPQTRQIGLFGGAVALDMTIRPDTWVGNPNRMGRMRAWESMGSDAEQFARSFEVVDADGRPFRVEPIPTPGMPGADGIRMIMNLTPRPGTSSTPAELRFYGQIKTTVEIPFDFKDLRLP